jgi:hypothetical protein
MEKPGRGLGKRESLGVIEKAQLVQVRETGLLMLDIQLFYWVGR